MNHNVVWILALLAACGGGGGGKADAVDPGTGTPDVPVPTDPATTDPGTPDILPADLPAADAGYTYPTCVELLPCTTACADDPCRQKCLAGASPQATTDLIALKTCLDTACAVCNKAGPTPDEQEQCDSCRGTAIYAGPCGAAFQKCGTFGKSACPEAWACVKACKDDECADGCMAGSTFAAHSLSLPLMGCISTACPGQDQLPWNACMEGATTGACKTLWEACQKDQ